MAQELTWPVYVTGRKNGILSLWSVKKNDVLRPGIVGIGGSMVVRLRPPDGPRHIHHHPHPHHLHPHHEHSHPHPLIHTTPTPKVLRSLAHVTFTPESATPTTPLPYTPPPHPEVSGTWPGFENGLYPTLAQPHPHPSHSILPRIPTFGLSICC